MAANYHERGYGCSQAVLASYAADFGLDEGLALRLATGFGSGMGRLCEVCGALTGAFMVIGIKYGKEKTEGTRYGNETETTYRLVAEAAAKFEQRNGFIYCLELLIRQRPIGCCTYNKYYTKVLQDTRKEFGRLNEMHT